MIVPNIEVFLPRYVKFTKKKIKINTFTGDPEIKARTKVQFKVLKKQFSLFIFHLGIKNIFWRVNIAKLEN